MTKRDHYEKLHKQLERGIITPEEYSQKCIEILAKEANGEL